MPAFEAFMAVVWFYTCILALRTPRRVSPDYGNAGDMEAAERAWIKELPYFDDGMDGE